MDYDGETFYVVNVLGEHLPIEITAGIVTGALIRTATEGERIEIDGQSAADRTRFHNTTGLDVAVIWIDTASDLHISAASDVELNASGEVRVPSSRLVIGETASQQGNHLRLRNVTDEAQILSPPAGYVSIFFNSAVGRIQAKNSAGTVVKLNEVDF